MLRPLVPYAYSGHERCCLPDVLVLVQHAVEQMRRILQQGSPASRVEEVKYAEPEQIDAPEATSFEIRR